METKIQEIRGHFGVPSQDAFKQATWAQELDNGPKMEPKGCQRHVQGGQMEGKEAKMEAKWSPKNQMEA